MKSSPEGSDQKTIPEGSDQKKAHHLPNSTKALAASASKMASSARPFTGPPWI